MKAPNIFINGDDLIVVEWLGDFKLILSKDCSASIAATASYAIKVAFNLCETAKTNHLVKSYDGAMVRHIAIGLQRIAANDARRVREIEEFERPSRRPPPRGERQFARTYDRDPDDGLSEENIFHARFILPYDTLRDFLAADENEPRFQQHGITKAVFAGGLVPVDVKMNSHYWSRYTQ